jgi:hypothetical protein
LVSGRRCTRNWRYVAPKKAIEVSDEEAGIVTDQDFMGRIPEKGNSAGQVSFLIHHAIKNLA